MMKTRSDMAERCVEGISFLIRHMQDVGLGYLALNREIPSLSGGEKQHLLLASHLGAA